MVLFKASQQLKLKVGYFVYCKEPSRPVVEGFLYVAAKLREE